MLSECLLVEIVGISCKFHVSVNSVSQTKIIEQLPSHHKKKKERRKIKGKTSMSLLAYLKWGNIKEQASPSDLSGKMGR